MVGAVRGFKGCRWPRPYRGRWGGWRELLALGRWLGAWRRYLRTADELLQCVVGAGQAGVKGVVWNHLFRGFTAVIMRP